MRHFGFTLVCSLFFAGVSFAQPPANGYPQVGSQLPRVGKPLPQVGTLPGVGIDTAARKQDPFGLQGYGIKPNQLSIDPKDAITPYPLGPAYPEKNYWDRLYDRWLELFTNTKIPAKNYTPGISRRNRERKEDRFRPD